MEKFKLLIINHSFQVLYYYRRWQLFAKDHPNVDVTLLAPAKSKWYHSKSYTYGGGGYEIEGKVVEDDNFHIHLVRKKDIRSSHWYSPDFKSELLNVSPDVVYHIGSHTQLSLIQIIFLTKKYLPKAKILAFSMRGPHHNLNVRRIKGLSKKALIKEISYWLSKFFLHYVNKNCDAIFCHYPDAVQAFKEEGYKGPVYMQTQVGVNTEWFFKDDKARNEIRKKYNLGNSYVFGSASRFTLDKGLDDILEALPPSGDWKYLMMGSGSDEDESRLKAIIKRRGLDDKVILPGFIDWFEISKYWNAIDCAIHVPRTTAHWVETFSLSVIQPMITGKPIIGNSSGSVPYQIGFPEMIVPEGDGSLLREKIEWVLKNRDQAKEIGAKMYERTKNSFTVNHLNNLFYHTLIEDVLCSRFTPEYGDMTNHVDID